MWTDIASIVGVVLSLIAVIVAWRKAPHEERNLDSSAAKAFEEAASLAAQRSERLDQKITQLEKLVAELQCKVKNVETENLDLKAETKRQDERIRVLEEENGDLMEWAEKLVIQVRNLGGTPIVWVRKISKVNGS